MGTATLPRQLFLTLIVLAVISVSSSYAQTVGSTSARALQLFRPRTATRSQINFLLYADPNDTDCCHVIERGSKDSLVASGYNASRPLKLLIHGALSNSKTQDDVKVIKDAYLRNGIEANVVMVDYGPLTMSRFPAILAPLSVFQTLLSMLRTNRIANEISDFILFLIKCQVISGPEQVHLIGFGLGAHAAGTVGRTVKQSDGRNVGRITGLDPFPFRRVSLDPRDATFVDVTNTAIGRYSLRRRGHVQFYLNGGGPSQPNCPRFPTSLLGCSHHSATFYYAKSIDKPKSICGCKCLSPKICRSRLLNSRSSCVDPVVYGEQVDKSSRGNYYVALTY